MCLRTMCKLPQAQEGQSSTNSCPSTSFRCSLLVSLLMRSILRSRHPAKSNEWPHLCISRAASIIDPPASSRVQPRNLASVWIADLAAPTSGHVRFIPRILRIFNASFVTSVMTRCLPPNLTRFRKAKSRRKSSEFDSSPVEKMEPPITVECGLEYHRRQQQFKRRNFNAETRGRACGEGIPTHCDNRKGAS